MGSTLVPRPIVLALKWYQGLTIPGKSIHTGLTGLLLSDQSDLNVNRLNVAIYVYH